MHNVYALSLIKVFIISSSTIIVKLVGHDHYQTLVFIRV